MANRIAIRRGSTTPTTNNLQSYELGWVGGQLVLYINNNGIIQQINGASSRGIELVSGDNIDTLNPGIYHSTGGDVSATLNGTLPTTSTGFRLDVINGYAGSKYRAQLAITNTGDLKIRFNERAADFSNIAWRTMIDSSGGTITDNLKIGGTLTVGTSSATSSDSHSLWTTGIKVHDTRYDTISTTSISKAANFFHSNTDMPNSNYWSGIHIKGWTGDYNAWEIVGPAHSTDQRTVSLCIRSGRTTNSWGAWRAIITASDATSRRIFVTTTNAVPSGAVTGDIVLVKAS